ncbi:hypothetical protein BDZ89DRAFT_1031961 [Hymenopellis radicata]|nr:hypothetical protein BDZ89DRAFT_1031961 [Hymenopellis radicata]
MDSRKRRLKISTREGLLSSEVEMGVIFQMVYRLVLGVVRNGQNRLDSIEAVLVAEKNGVPLTYWHPRFVRLCILYWAVDNYSAGSFGDRVSGPNVASLFSIASGDESARSSMAVSDAEAAFVDTGKETTSEYETPPSSPADVTEGNNFRSNVEHGRERGDVTTFSPSYVH